MELLVAARDDRYQKHVVDGVVDDEVDVKLSSVDAGNEQAEVYNKTENTAEKANSMGSFRYAPLGTCD